MKILGHRGCRTEGIYQNSDSAFREALDHADGLETDAVVSADGVVFLNHDTAYAGNMLSYDLAQHLDPPSAVAAGDRRVDQITADELATLRLKNGEPIPRLDNLLTRVAAHPQAILNIELKEAATALPVAQALSAGPLPAAQVIVSSFNHPELALFRRLAPQVKLGALFALPTQSRRRMYPWLDDEACYVPFAPERLSDALIEDIAPDFINLSLETIAPANVAAIRQRRPEARLLAWTASEPPAERIDGTLATMAELAADGFLYGWITDQPRQRKSQWLALATKAGGSLM